MCSSCGALDVSGPSLPWFLAVPAGSRDLFDCGCRGVVPPGGYRADPAPK